LASDEAETVMAETGEYADAHQPLRRRSGAKGGWADLKSAGPENQKGKAFAFPCASSLLFL
jgi:hypothetical protein